MENNKHFFPYIASFLCGLAVYLIIILATGRNEAWDDGSYYFLGMPLMCIVAFLIGYLFPLKPWRWSLSMAAGQTVGALLGGSSLSLLPLAIIFMVVISMPQFIAAAFGSKLSAGKAGK